MLAVLVVHDGATWLPEVLDALAAQTYPAMEVIAVDNRSRDASRDLLLERLPVRRLLVADQDLGFAGAVSMALDSALAARCDPTYLLLVHDDLVLAPDAVMWLVERARRDQRLAVVGPKLLRHDDPRRIQQVGMSVDLTGRADSGLEPDELDQGQRDRPRPVLYVSSAGMLVRRDRFDELGRFDRRYRIFRDDLDLCWRAWLAGHDVEVAPAAVGRHARAASNFVRAGQALDSGPRYFAERNTLATLLKCYGWTRLLVVVPLYFVVGGAKLVGFLLTRRVGDAWMTLRAWAWNLRHLRGTLRLRRSVQEGRLRSDLELRPLFARAAPRVRAYAEAVADRLAGGEADVPAPAEERTADRDVGPFLRVLRFGALHPVLAAAGIVALLTVIGGMHLLGGGPMRGGDFAPWPASPLDFFREYLAGWHGAGGLGTDAPPSPAQALLGIVGVLALGNEWLAPRLLVFGALPVAVVLALLAGRLVAPGRPPRAAAALLYALSPPVVAAVVTGDLGGLAAVVLVPGLVVVGTPVLSLRSPRGRAWRATAGSALLAATLVAFEPRAAPLLLVVVAVSLVVVGALPAPAAERRNASVRILAAAAGAFVLLLPWSLELVRPGTPVLGAFSGSDPTSLVFLRALLLTPDLPGFGWYVLGIVYPIGGLLAVLLTFPRRPITILALWTTVLVAAIAAWGMGQLGAEAPVPPGTLLVVGALAYAGLIAAALGSAPNVLAGHAFGWRQVTTLVTGAVLAVGTVALARAVIVAPWDAYATDTSPLPAFITADEPVVGPYRIVVLAERDGVVEWDATEAHGPTMLEYGAADGQELAELIGDTIEDITAGISPAGGSQLGLANVRYVYVPEGGRSDALTAALADQSDLEPQPVERGLVYLVRRWLPRAAHVTPGVAVSTDRRGELPPDADPQALERRGRAAYAGPVPGPGAILLAEAADRGWRATAAGRALEAHSSAGLQRFTVPLGVEDVTVTFALDGRRRVAVALQALAGLLAISLVLRPPGFTQEVV